MLGTALQLIAKGMAVFACRPWAKQPATPRGFLDASRDPAVIEEWWGRNANFNIGVATGQPSNVVVVDIDSGEAETALRRLEEGRGQLPSTVEVITARGRHMYFRWPGFAVPSSAGRIAPGIDLRADHAYVLAPPSIHPSGRRYTWSVDSASSFAPLPEWLLSMAAPTKRAANAPTPPAEWRDLVANGVAEGARDASATRLAGYLLRRCIDPVVALELLQSWNAVHCHPPLPTTDIVRIVNSIAGREIKRRANGSG